jgi:hypothetical protein
VNNLTGVGAIDGGNGGKSDEREQQGVGDDLTVHSQSMMLIERAQRPQSH